MGHTVIEKLAVVMLAAAGLVNVVEAGCESQGSCQIQDTDLVFLLDGSGSVGSEGFQQALEFMGQIIEHIPVEGRRIGVVQFSTSARTEFNLNDFDGESNAVIQDKIMQISYMSARTQIAVGLRHVMNSALTEENGDRPGVTNTVILIADGTSDDNPEVVADELRQTGAQLISVVVKPSAGTLAQLARLSNDPSNTFAVTDYDQLNVAGLVNQIICAQAQAGLCKPMPEIENGSFNVTCAEIGDPVMFSCQESYYNEGNDTITCQHDRGLWPETLECLPRPCACLGDLLRGSYDPPRAVFGEAVRVTCDPGYQLSQCSPTQISCDPNGQWNEPLPVCEPKSCEVLTPPQNGAVEPQESIFGQSVEFTCEAGYGLSDPFAAIQQCNGDGTWTDLPTCLPLTQVNVTADNVLESICVDGQVILGSTHVENYNEWRVKGDVFIPNKTRVFGIHAKNEPYQGKMTHAAVLVELSNGIFSNGQWKCHASAPPDNWCTAEFDDSSWSDAKVIGKYDFPPWDQHGTQLKELEFPNAYWIWHAEGLRGVDEDGWCRVKFELF